MHSGNVYEFFTDRGALRDMRRIAMTNARKERCGGNGGDGDAHNNKRICHGYEESDEKRHFHCEGSQCKHSRKMEKKMGSTAGMKFL